jgi:dTDP-glucose 4,6-dehydratase
VRNSDVTDNRTNDQRGSRFRRAIVTGGGGFLGSYTCEMLLDRGVEVFAVDNFCTGHPSYLTHLRDRDGFTFIEADVTEDFDVPRDPDLVLHLASPASLAGLARLPLETMTVNSVGTQRMLEVARRSRARFVLASTSDVYGDPLQHPQHEDYWGNVNPIGPRAIYDEAKRYGEAMTMAYARHFGVSTGIVRIFNSYGPRMRPDGRVVSGFIAQATQGRPLTIHGDGNQTRSPCFAEDTARGILAIAESDYGMPVNIGTTEELTVLELAYMVRDISGSDSPIEFLAADEDDPRRRCPDLSRAKRELGWEPRVPLAEGLRRTVAYALQQRGASRGEAS